jgi:hypothetical protein
LNDFLEQKIKESKKPKLIDVVEEVKKDYKKKEEITEDKLDKYKKYYIKKSKIKYEKELIQLQVELLKLQKHIKEN